MRIKEYLNFCKESFNYDGAMSVWSNKHRYTCLYSFKLFVGDNNLFDMYWARRESIVHGGGDKMVAAVRMDKNPPVIVGERVSAINPKINEWMYNYLGSGDTAEHQERLRSIVSRFEDFHYPHLFSNEFEGFVSNLHRICVMCEKSDKPEQEEE